jgi:hypothetical protein
VAGGNHAGLYIRRPTNCFEGLVFLAIISLNVYYRFRYWVDKQTAENDKET